MNVLQMPKEGGRAKLAGILTWRGFGCDQEGGWSGTEQALALWCCEVPMVFRDQYRTIFGLGSLRLRISCLESNGSWNRIAGCNRTLSSEKGEYRFELDTK